MQNMQVRFSPLFYPGNPHELATSFFLLLMIKCPQISAKNPCNLNNPSPLKYNSNKSALSSRNAAAILAQPCFNKCRGVTVWASCHSLAVSPWHLVSAASISPCGQTQGHGHRHSHTQLCVPWLGNKSIWQGRECECSRSLGVSEAVIRGVCRSAMGIGGGGEAGGRRKRKEGEGELAGLFEYQALPQSGLRWQLHYLRI